VVVGTLELDLRIEGSFSLKDKRRVLRSLMDRARREFHVAIAEVGDHEIWNSAVLGAACVTTATDHAEAILQSVIDLADQNPEAEVCSAVKKIKRY
jgi:uncharacterized protein YlxP (DUF503 family)